MLSTIIDRAEPRRSAAPDRQQQALPISARHELLSCSSRRESVRELKAAIRRLESGPKLPNPCDMALFEINGRNALRQHSRHDLRPSSVN
jgi:hypothetical protein